MSSCCSGHHFFCSCHYRSNLQAKAMAYSRNRAQSLPRLERVGMKFLIIPKRDPETKKLCWGRCVVREETYVGIPESLSYTPLYARMWRTVSIS